MGMEAVEHVRKKVSKSLKEKSIGDREECKGCCVEEMEFVV
jgi:hypothetical protein